MFYSLIRGQYQVLTREPSPSEAVIQKINADVGGQNLDSSKLELTTQNC